MPAEAEAEAVLETGSSDYSHEGYCIPLVVAPLVVALPAEALYRGSRNREDRVAALPAESEAVVAAEEVEEADFDPPSTPSNLFGNQPALHPRNQTSLVVALYPVEAVELQAAARLPVACPVVWVRYETGPVVVAQAAAAAS